LHDTLLEEAGRREQAMNEIHTAMLLFLHDRKRSRNKRSRNVYAGEVSASAAGLLASGTFPALGKAQRRAGGRSLAADTGQMVMG
jgi:hypothetical protein